jgi:hypothetical protein
MMQKSLILVVVIWWAQSHCMMPTQEEQQLTFYPWTTNLADPVEREVTNLNYPSLKCHFEDKDLITRGENVWLITAIDMEQLEPLRVDFDCAQMGYTKNNYILINKSKKNIYLPFWPREEGSNLAIRRGNYTVLFKLGILYVQSLKKSQNILGINCTPHGSVDVRGVIVDEYVDVATILRKSRLSVALFLDSFTSYHISLAIKCYRNIQETHGEDYDRSLFLYEEWCRNRNQPENPEMLSYFWDAIQPAFGTKKVTRNFQTDYSLVKALPVRMEMALKQTEEKFPSLQPKQDQVTNEDTRLLSRAVFSGLALMGLGIGAYVYFKSYHAMDSPCSNGLCTTYTL